ncbi:cyclin G [Bemisia tabaci]|uniref:cyclin G n=1 Tax=Bemisia tabaci TaxID=7038 RepID=UPI003B27CF79
MTRCVAKMNNAMLPEALKPLVAELQEALALEHKFVPNLQLISVSQEGGDITNGIRDGSAHVLRCLKVWYDLPADVLFTAINYMDCFLTKMRVKPKFMACISVACFQLACTVVPGVTVPDATDLVSISQCKCSASDLARMQSIISSKLGIHPDRPPITSATLLRLYHKLFTAVDASGLYSSVVEESSLHQHLEIIACDTSCANFRPSEIALVLICSQMDLGVARLSTPHPMITTLMTFATNLQHLCKITESNFYRCHEAVLCIMQRYHAQVQMPYRQRLVWRLSQRTLQYLRPTDKLTMTLPTIDEHGQLQLPVCARMDRCGSGCSWDDNKCSF